AVTVGEAVQKQVTPVDLYRLGAHATEDRGEFNRDIAAAQHQDPARQAFEIEGCVRGDGVLFAGDVGHLGPAAGGHQDMPRRVALTVDLYGMRVGQAGVALVQRHAAAHQQVAVDAVQAFDFAVFVGD